MRGNILVVDDNLASRETLQTILEYQGHRVTTAANGYEALERVRETSFDIVFLDFRLPDASGGELLQELKRIRPQMAIILMTGYQLEEVSREAMASGAYAHLPKPYEMKEALAIVEEVLRAARDAGEP